MKRYLVLGVLFFLIFGIAFAPASIIGNYINNNVAGIRLSSVNGTIWQGQTDIQVDNVPAPLGRLTWSFAPATILKLRLGYTYHLRGDGLKLVGDISTNGFNQKLSAQGEISAGQFNLWLQPYDINITGAVQIENFRTTVATAEPPRQLAVEDLSGQLTWPGGDVIYVLSGHRSQASLPALNAELETQSTEPTMTVMQQSNGTPVINAALLDDGFVRLGVTKQLTKLLNNPWPGNDTDESVVLEVEQQIFGVVNQ